MKRAPLTAKEVVVLSVASLLVGPAWAVRVDVLSDSGRVAGRGRGVGRVGSHLPKLELQVAPACLQHGASAAEEQPSRPATTCRFPSRQLLPLQLLAQRIALEAYTQSSIVRGAVSPHNMLLGKSPGTPLDLFARSAKRARLTAPP